MRAVIHGVQGLRAIQYNPPPLHVNCNKNKLTCLLGDSYDLYYSIDVDILARVTLETIILHLLHSGLTLEPIILHSGQGDTRDYYMHITFWPG